MKLMKFSVSVALISLIAIVSGCGQESGNESNSSGQATSAPQLEAVSENEIASARPNILLILADDLGYSDIGVFGSEIATPNIDQLAADGLTLTNFHVHVFCTPTRAMLLTGANNHIAGIGTMAGEWRGEQKGAPGYETYLTDRVVTVAQLLKDAGYSTLISGKWDLGGRQDDAHLPINRGFEKSYILVEGSADHFRKAPALAELPNINYRENGVSVEPPERFYSSDLYTEKIIEQIDAGRDSDKPFFAYLSFTAPHYPLQAPDEYIAKYEGVYDGGYDAIRLARLERMREKGLFSDELEPAPPSDEWPTWDELSPKHQAFEVRRMQVYAAMVESMDANIGRVLKYLDEIGERENTLIVFLSDNGAEGGNVLDWADYYVDWAEDSFDLSLENLGRDGSFAWTGPQWAHVSSAPYRMFKAFPTRGGVLSPTIINHPSLSAGGRISSAMATAMDLPATFLEVAGVQHPGTEYAGRQVAPLEGRSLLNLLQGKSKHAHDGDDVFVWEMIDRRAVQKGNWKIVWINKPWGKGVGEWSLFDLETDPTELNDVAAENPEIVADLLDAWEEYVAENNLVLADYSNLTYTNKKSHFEWLPKAASGQE